MNPTEPSESVVSLTRDEFEKLPEYSATLPTGVVIGKCWRRKMRANQWIIGEYVASATKEHHAEVRWSRLKILDEAPVSPLAPVGEPRCPVPLAAGERDDILIAFAEARAPAALQRETDEATVKVVLLCPTCSLSKRDALAVACGDRFHEWMRPAPEADGENGPWSQEQRKAARAVMDLGVNALCLSSMKRADEAVCGEIAKVAPLFVAQPAARGVVTDAMRAAIGLSPEPNKGVGYSTGREGRWSEVTVPYRDELAAQLAMLHWCQARKDLAAIDANTALAAPQKATEASVTIRLQDSVP